jgi:hypothetical protein
MSVIERPPGGKLSGAAILRQEADEKQERRNSKRLHLGIGRKYECNQAGNGLTEGLSVGAATEKYGKS